MPLTAGNRIGAYEILAPLGAGGMGEVYRARDTRLERDVAIKVLPAALASNPERLARFEREARTVAGLNHPNIVVLHSIEDDGGVRFLTMELVEGQNLATLVAAGGLPLAKLLDLAIPLADALIAAHEKGVVHRDLKPANVMVTRDGRVKVLDFGLARVGDNDPAASGVGLTQAATMTTPLSTAGQVLGTVSYMAPEQVRGEAADARSDLFAIGIMLYELATGRRPFPGEHFVDIAHAILHDTPEQLAIQRPDLPEDFDRIVERCLEKSTRDRMPSALEMAIELKRLRRAIERGEAVAPRERPARPIASIAVLPFANRSASAEDEYFSDGLADELLNVLAKIKGLRVSARASSFHFRGHATPLAEVGRALKVDTVLDGSVRKAGNRVRISVQLVKVADGYHLWSETYDRTLDDIFAVQDDIAQAVVKELRTTLLGESADSAASGEARAEVAQAARGRTTHPEAHRLYLLARHLSERLHPQDSRRAIEYLDQAVAIDPEFAMAWTERGRAYAIAAGAGWGMAVDEGYTNARRSVDRALALEPDLAAAHAVKARLQVNFEWDWRGAEVSVHRALELEPANPYALHLSGLLAVKRGDAEAAVGFYGRAVEVNPLGVSSQNNLGFALHRAGRPGEAGEAYARAIEMTPQRMSTRNLRALALLAQGRVDEAMTEALAEPDEGWRLQALAMLHDAANDRAASDQALNALIAGYGGDSAYQIAEVFGRRAQLDEAFSWLERARAQRDGGLVGAQYNPLFQSLHADPRWHAFVEAMGYDA
jgi:serine/threonine protein kinase/Tfp pilus assembly protein PilF